MREELRERARALGLHGLVERWDEVAGTDWVEELIESEERVRMARSYERRRGTARLPAFKPMADFDWTWPRDIVRGDVEALMGLGFVGRADNAVLVGGQGTGKTMIAANAAHQALLHGHTVRFEKAPDLLENLAATVDRQARQDRLKLLARPHLLVLDEIGYVKHEPRHADILHAIVSKRYQNRSTMVTTSLGFAQWDRVFPSASGIAGTIDRLMHDATLVRIDGDSWRLRRETR